MITSSRHAYARLVPGLAVASYASIATAAPVADERDDATTSPDSAVRGQGEPEAGRARGTTTPRLRVHVDSELFGGAWVHRATPMPDVGRDTLSVGLGLARPSLLDDGSALFTRPVFGIGVGWRFPETRAWIGAKVSLTLDAYAVTESEGARMLAIGGRVAPYLRWMFRPGRAVRPFVEMRVGLGGISTTRRDPSGGRVRSRVMVPVVGAGAGAHVFVRAWFSVDVGVNVDYAAPLVRTGGARGFGGASAWAKRADVVGFGALLGASAWF